MWTVSIRDHTARFVQFDLDLHCPQTLPVSSSVRKEITLTVLDLCKSKAFADENLNMAPMSEKNVSYTAENIVGKGENGGNQHFLLFPRCFSKVFCFGDV